MLDEDIDNILLEMDQLDPETFGLIYDKYYQPVFGFIYSRTRNNELAKDLTSETFFQALKNISKFKPQKNKKVQSWIFAIAVAQIGNYYRKVSKLFEVTTEEAPEILAKDEYQPDIAMQIGEDAVELKQQIDLLTKMMKKLSCRQQDIITLRFFSKMTIPEIADVVKMKEGTVKSHIHRAIKKLRKLMDEENEKEERGDLVVTEKRNYYENANASTN